MIYDLIVIGGGPAGCAAAITTARAGAKVLLLERGRFPRHKVCGEFVSAESLNLLESLLSKDNRAVIAGAPRIAEARIFLDRAVVRATISPAAASIARFDLDHSLWNASLRAGVDAQEKCTVQAIEGGGPFQVVTGGEVFVSRALINATGRWSFLTGAATRELATRERWIGLKAHFCENSPPPSVDLYFFDGGYCGVQALGSAGNGHGVINACAMVRSDVASDLKQVLRCHPRLEERSWSWRAKTEPVSTSPLAFHEPEPTQGLILQAGDAATFVDPFVGDGISLGLRSGALAAQCLTGFFRGELLLAEAAAAYEKKYRQQLAPVFRASSRLRTLLRFPAILRRPVLSLLQKTPAITRRLVTMTR